MTLQTYLKEVRRRCEKATPLPWMAINGMVMGLDHERVVCTVACESYIVSGVKRYDSPTENQNFIIHARTDVPRLLKMVELLMQEVRAEYCYDEVRRVEQELDRLVSEAASGEGE